MKLNGIVGKGSGKLGASVFAISGGEQIVRQYNPQVSNPNTSAQIAQRAKLKLMSQLAAALAPALAFKKKGLVSARNQFVAKNIGLASYANDQASVGVALLQLTDGSITIPEPTAVRGAGDIINISMPAATAVIVDNIVYVLAEKNEYDQLQFLGTYIAQPGNDNTFPVAAAGSANNIVVYAYGVKLTSDASSSLYGTYVAAGGDTNATLDVALRNAIANAITTVTAGVEVAAAG